MKQALDGYIQFRVAGLGPDWMDHEEEAIQCLGHIFRCDDDKEKQFAYLEKEGVPMTVKAEKVLNEYSEDQFKWFHRSEKEKYDRLKEQMETKLEADRKEKERLKEQMETKLEAERKEKERLKEQMETKLEAERKEKERLKKENEMLRAMAKKREQNSNLSVAENAPGLPDYLDEIHD